MRQAIEFNNLKSLNFHNNNNVACCGQRSVILALILENVEIGKDRFFSIVRTATMYLLFCNLMISLVT